MNNTSSSTNTLTEVWSKPHCPYCVKAKQLLTDHNIPYREYIISAGLDENPVLENQQYVTKEQLLEKYPAAKTVPQIWLNGVHVGGYTDLEALFKSGGLPQ